MSSHSSFDDDESEKKYDLIAEIKDAEGNQKRKSRDNVMNRISVAPKQDSIASLMKTR